MDEVVYVLLPPKGPLPPPSWPAGPCKLESHALGLSLRLEIAAWVEADVIVSSFCSFSPTACQIRLIAEEEKNGLFYQSSCAKRGNHILLLYHISGCICQASFRLFHADDCPHLNHGSTIGSNWHVALAVLGEIWGCVWPRTGCPFHQLESCLLVGWEQGGSTSLLPCLLIKMICGDPLSLLPPACPSLRLSLRWGIAVCELLVRVSLQSRTPASDWQPYSSSQWDIHIRGALTVSQC